MAVLSIILYLLLFLFIIIIIYFVLFSFGVFWGVFVLFLVSLGFITLHKKKLSLHVFI